MYFDKSIVISSYKNKGGYIYLLINYISLDFVQHLKYPKYS